MKAVRLEMFGPFCLPMSLKAVRLEMFTRCSCDALLLLLKDIFDKIFKGFAAKVLTASWLDMFGQGFR